jgi:hypothetical protein
MRRSLSEAGVHVPMFISAALCPWRMATESSKWHSLCLMFHPARRDVWRLRVQTWLSRALSVCLLLQALDQARHTAENSGHRLSQISSEIGDDRPISGVHE